MTGPDAGSDAASMPDTGIVCRGLHEGAKSLVSADFHKRYITQAPLATVMASLFVFLIQEHLNW